MALNACKANNNRIDSSAAITESKLAESNGRYTNCFVNNLHKIKVGDFITYSSDHKYGHSIGKIVKLFGNAALVRCFKRKDELPKEVINSSIDKNEVIESDFGELKLSKHCIIGKCVVIGVPPEGSVATVLAENQDKEKTIMYVCRYKLVKKTIYELLPITWSNETNLSSSNNENDINTVENEEIMTNGLNRLHLGTGKIIDDQIKLVSPIKIVNNSVQKVKRNENYPINLSIERKRGDTGYYNNNYHENASDDDDGHNKKINKKIDDENGSPNKKAKYQNDTHTNELTEIIESPDHRNIRNGQNKRLSNVTRNLNTSFMDSPDIDKNDSVTNLPTYNIVENSADEGKPLVTRLRRAQISRTATPLKEITPNNEICSRRENLLKEIHKGFSEPFTPKTRRSILKNADSGKNTPKGNVTFKGAVEEQKTDKTSETPVEVVRKSSRLASMDASAKINANKDSSPEATPELNRAHSSKAKKDSIYATPKTTRRRSTVAVNTPSKAEITPSITRKLFRSGTLTPSMQFREAVIEGEQTELEMIRERLHVSAVPTSLPCRENEFDDIYSFVKGKINDECGGCIYISGVPGTGKTATVTQVVRALQAESKRKKVLKFDYIEINGMRLTEPRQAYVQMYRQLTGKTLAWAQARDLLEKRFTESSKKQLITILLLDELDIICNRKQDVVYNLFDWTARKGSKLIAITIANTMDLPERVLKLKVASRLGLTRITFQPYTFKQLHEVVMARLGETDRFNSGAVQLIARKVASVSGDCRRALDICRRATEIAEIQTETAQIDDVKVSFEHVQQALNEMFASPKVRAIKSCTQMEKLFLRAVETEISRTGIEEVVFFDVYVQLGTLAPLFNIKNPPNTCQALQICTTLGACRLLIVEDSAKDIFQKIILNVSVDDLYYALNS